MLAWMHEPGKEVLRTLKCEIVDEVRVPTLPTLLFQRSRLSRIFPRNSQSLRVGTRKSTSTYLGKVGKIK